MSVSEFPFVSKSLVARVKGIIMRPNEEWAAIDTEPATVGGLYMNYIAPLSAVPVIARLIGVTVFGSRWGYYATIRVPIMIAIENAIGRYILGLVGVYIFAFVIDALAPTFGGKRDRVQALKIVAYSMTALWLAGIFAIIPALILLGILGLYSLYLIYLGIPVLMKAPPERAAGYTIVSIVCGVILFMIIESVARSFMGGYGAIG
jgi:hypothetical protein